MADDMVVLQCESCGTRLKIRAVTVKIMKEIKCAKCGHKVSTRGGAPAPAVAPASVPGADAPAAVLEPVAAPPPPAPAALPVPAVAVDDTRLREVESQLAATRERVAELERQLAERASAHAAELERAQQRVREIEAAHANAAGSGDELAQARKTIAEQEDRLGQLQELWYQKEKESRAAQAQATKARQESQQVLGQVHALLKSYHESEIQAATQRIADLEARLSDFLKRALPPGP